MQSEEAALLTFLDLSNYKGDCRQDTQPISPILKTKGRSATWNFLQIYDKAASSTL